MPPFQGLVVVSRNANLGLTHWLTHPGYTISPLRGWECRPPSARTSLISGRNKKSADENQDDPFEINLSPRQCRSTNSPRHRPVLGLAADREWLQSMSSAIKAVHPVW